MTSVKRFRHQQQRGIATILILLLVGISIEHLQRSDSISSPDRTGPDHSGPDHTDPDRKPLAEPWRRPSWLAASGAVMLALIWNAQRASHGLAYISKLSSYWFPD